MKKFYPQKPGDAYFEELQAFHSRFPFLPDGDQTKPLHIEAFDKGEPLIRYSSTVDTLYYILSGTAKIYMIHDDGKQSLLQFAGKDDFVGELTLLGAEPTPKDVIALTPCLCMAFPLQPWMPYLLGCAPFLHRLCVYLANKVLSRTERLSENANYPLKHRLAAYILLTEHDGLYTEKHVETAEYLGVSYRHLLYTLQQLSKGGVLTKQSRGYAIVDRQALMKLANTN